MAGVLNTLHCLASGTAIGKNQLAEQLAGVTSNGTQLQMHAQYLTGNKQDANSRSFAPSLVSVSPQ